MLFMGILIAVLALIKVLRRDTRPFYLIAGPLMLIILYFDITRGQFMPIFPNLNVLFSIAVSVVTIIAAEKLADAYFIRTNKKLYFYVCPRCKYKNIQLTSKCEKCHFEAEDKSNIGLAAMPLDVGIKCDDFESFLRENEKVGLSADVRKSIFQMLGLTTAECVIVNFKKSLVHNLRINGVGEHYKNLIVTNKRIILIDCPLWGGGWRRKESISLNDIDSVDIEMTIEYSADIPILRFISDGKEYRMRGNARDKYKFNQLAKTIMALRTHS